MMKARDMTALATTLAGVRVASPIVLAAGTAGTLDELVDVVDVSCTGVLVSKSITPLAREGNPTHRILPHPSPTGAGMLNAIGLANPGVEAFVSEYAPRIAACPCAVFVSVAAFSVDGYAQVAARVMSGGAAQTPKGLELNLSCPNVHGNVEFGASPSAAAEVARAVRRAVGPVPIFVKLSPVAPDILGIARAVVEAMSGEGTACGLTIGNTIPAMAIDPRTRRPLLANVTGGLSGPAIHAASVRSVYEVFSRFGRDLYGKGKHLPIIGLGGVSRWQDAAEFVLAGASAVGVGTMLFADPGAPRRIAQGLGSWVTEQGRSNIGELVGDLVLS